MVSAGTCYFTEVSWVTRPLYLIDHDSSDNMLHHQDPFSRDKYNIASRAADYLIPRSHVLWVLETKFP